MHGERNPAASCGMSERTRNGIREFHAGKVLFLRSLCAFATIGRIVEIAGTGQISPEDHNPFLV